MNELAQSLPATIEIFVYDHCEKYIGVIEGATIREAITRTLIPEWDLMCLRDRPFLVQGKKHVVGGILSIPNTREAVRHMDHLQSVGTWTDVRAVDTEGGRCVSYILSNKIYVFKPTRDNIMEIDNVVRWNIR